MYSQGAHHNPADGHVELSCLDIVAKSSTGGIIVPIRIILNSAIYEALACLNCRCPEFDLRAAAPENAACGDDGRRKHLQSQSRSAAPTGAQSRLFTRIEGDGTDAKLMRSYLAAWGDKEAYAVAHVGFGMNPRARYEALTLYDQPDTNGTELRAVAGNFLFSTGANEFAGRYTAGHFDIPVMRTTITVDGTEVVSGGVLQDVFG